MVISEGMSGGSAEEGGEAGDPELAGSCRESQPALASASLSRVTRAKSRFIAAVLYASWLAKASSTRTDFQGITGFSDKEPSGVRFPLLPG